MIELKITSSLDTFTIKIIQQIRVNEYLLIVGKQEKNEFIIIEEAISAYNNVIDILKYVKRIYTLKVSEIEYAPSRFIDKSDIKEIFLISENNIKIMP